MYRVMHIMPGADAGGISGVVLNYYRYMDRQKFHFDIAITSDRDGLNGQALRQLGCRFYRLPVKSADFAAYEKALVKILQEEVYDAIHVHDNETSYVSLRIAKKLGIPNRFAHSHTSSPYVSVKSELRRLSGCVLNCFYATRAIACGELAGVRVFGKGNMRRKKTVVLPNAIDTHAFCFDAQTRSSMRRELDVEDRFVIGMVGRLSPEKNHRYALKLMKQLCQRCPEAILLLAGNGEEEAAIRQQISDEGLDANVTLLGKRSDVAQLYQAFDALIMPSFHEGFPVAAVEALASGLPVMLSNTITRELQFSSAAHYLPLGDDDRWIQGLLSCRSGSDRPHGAGEVRTHGLDVRDTAKQLETIYTNQPI